MRLSNTLVTAVALIIVLALLLLPIAIVVAGAWNQPALLW